MPLVANFIMRRSIDKLNESGYYFQKVQNLISELKFEKSPEAIVLLIQNLRFELNSYINSHRATTFTLQAELRTKFGAQFESWYSKKIFELRKHPFSKTLLELRNINQKEGNLFPTFLLKNETENFVFIYEFDLIAPENTFLKPFLITPKNRNIRFDLPPVRENENPFSITKEQESSLKFQLFQILSNEVKKNGEEVFLVEKIKISRFKAEYYPTEFLENLREMGKQLEDIIAEGKVLFE